MLRRPPGRRRRVAWSVCHEGGLLRRPRRRGATQRGEEQPNAQKATNDPLRRERRLGRANEREVPDVGHEKRGAHPRARVASECVRQQEQAAAPHARQPGALEQRGRDAQRQRLARARQGARGAHAQRVQHHQAGGEAGKPALRETPGGRGRREQQGRGDDDDERERQAPRRPEPREAQGAPRGPQAHAQGESRQEPAGDGGRLRARRVPAGKVKTHVCPQPRGK